MNKVFKSICIDLFVCVISAAIVSFSIYYFTSHNGFVPGGINGLASLVGHFTGISRAYFIIIFNLPTMLLFMFLINKRRGVFLIVYMLTQSLLLLLYENLSLPYFQTDNLVFAALGDGVVTGIGFSLMFRQFGASGGTYTISSLIKRFRPATNIAYISFFTDSIVVIIAFVAYEAGVEAALATLIDLFIANTVVDYFLQGLKKGFRFEIITDQPDDLAKEILTTMHHGVTHLRVEGMYTGQGKSLLICIVRKRQIGTMMKLLAKYPQTFSSFSKVNEVFGRFRK